MPQTIKNDVFSVNIADDGSFSITDLACGKTWTADPWGEGAGLLSLYTARGVTGDRAVTNIAEEPPKTRLRLSQADNIIISPADNTATITFRWDNGIHLESKLSLSEKGLEVIVEALGLPDGMMFHELHYPLRLGSVEADEKGYIVLPNQSGMMIPTHKYGRIGGEWWRMDDASFVPSRWGGRFQVFGQLSMNWFGVQHGDAGLLFILETPFDAAVDFLANTHNERFDVTDGRIVMERRMSCCTPVWQGSLLKFAYRRCALIQPVGASGYVEMCSRYRAWCDEKGWTRTLNEKIAANPDRERLIGSTHIDIYGGYPHYVRPRCEQLEFTFDELVSLIERLKTECGLERADIAVWGCFDHSPPECWPIVAHRGGEDGWKRCCDKAKELGYLICAYHAYSPNMENGDCFLPERSYKPIPWTRSPFSRSRWSRTCSSYFLEAARRNLVRERETCGPNADFTDILGVYAGTECYATNHEHAEQLTREQDYENRRKVFRFIHDDLNLPNATEHGSSYLVREVDSFNGVMRHSHGDINILLPLLQLCFHDCVVTRPHPGLTYRNKGLSQFAEQVLMDISFGNAPLHSMQLWEYEGRREDLMMIDRVVGKLHRKTGREKMTNHVFLDSNYLVRRTEYADGTVVHTNAGLNPYEDGSIKLGGYGYQITFGDGEVLSGRIHCQIVEDRS